MTQTPQTPQLVYITETIKWDLLGSEDSKHVLKEIKQKIDISNSPTYPVSSSLDTIGEKHVMRIIFPTGASVSDDLIMECREVWNRYKEKNPDLSGFKLVASFLPHPNRTESPGKVCFTVEMNVLMSDKALEAINSIKEGTKKRKISWFSIFDK